MQGKKQTIETISESLMLDLADKNYKVITISISKEWKKIMFKELKRNMTIKATGKMIYYKILEWFLMERE